MSRPALALLQRSQSLPPISRALMGVTVAVLTWEMRARSRKSLAKLDDHLLRDIGVGRADAEVEWQKPFWWK